MTSFSARRVRANFASVGYGGKMPGSDSSQAPQIAFYRSDDLIMGFLGPHGAAGVWRNFLGSGHDWEFCAPESKDWDWYHQKVFRQGRAESCDWAEIADRLPPVPHGDPPPEKYHLREPPEPEALLAQPGSTLSGHVAAADGRLPVYVVLYEDCYESSFGDGVFRDFDGAFPDESTARAYIAAKLDQVAPDIRVEYHVRPMHLEVKEGSLVLNTEGAELSPFDHFTLSQVTDDLAQRLEFSVFRQFENPARFLKRILFRVLRLIRA